MSYSLGIDLGTTSVAAAVGGPDRIEMVTLGDQTVVAPAVVHVRDDATVLTGDAAERRALGQPDRVGRALKRRLTDRDPIVLGGTALPVTELLGAELRDALAKVVARMGGTPDRVVLTRPAHWGPTHRARFDEVAEEAGLVSPQQVTEAEAVACAVAGRLDEGTTAAVYALGGGCAEAFVLRRHSGGVDIVGTPQGTDALGGVDFDDAILSYVDETTRGALRGLDRDDAGARVALARLRQDCVHAKEVLSLDTETVIPVFLPGWHFEVRLTRSTFEDLIRSRLEQSVEAMSRALQTAGVTKADLDAVLLVGGSSRIPLVTQMVTREWGRAPLEGVDATYAVALGAASVSVSASAPTPRARSGGAAVTTLVSMPRKPDAEAPGEARPAAAAASPSAAATIRVDRADVRAALARSGAMAPGPPAARPSAGGRPVRAEPQNPGPPPMRGPAGPGGPGGPVPPRPGGGPVRAPQGPPAPRMPGQGGPPPMPPPPPAAPPKRSNVVVTVAAIVGAVVVFALVYLLAPARATESTPMTPVKATTGASAPATPAPPP